MGRRGEFGLFDRLRKMPYKVFKFLKGYQNVRKLKDTESTKMSEKLWGSFHFSMIVKMTVYHSISSSFPPSSNRFQF